MSSSPQPQVEAQAQAEGSGLAPAPAPPTDPRARRAAALAAIEARLRPPPSYDESEAGGGGGGDVHMEVAAKPSSGSAQPGDASLPTTPTVSASEPVTNSSSVTTPSRPASTNPAAQARAAAAAARLNALNNANAAASGSGRTAWIPSEKEDRELRIKFGRLLDRGIVRDNGYRQSAEAVETLLKIANNIIESDDPKFRTLKATNSMLKNKVLAARGGHDYLIALGFRTQTVNFSQQYVFSATLKKMHELKIGAEILNDHIAALQKRVSLANQSVVNGASVEAARRAAALAEIEADRDTVKARVERERIAREAKERKAKEEAEAAAAREAEAAADQHDEDQREQRETVVRSDQGGDEDDGELPSYAEDRESRGWGGPGRRLGA
ncbi:hypothetical protein I316_00525 [Kwoniella heveanensis BCC8398]|uniref:PUB domain-containing protein n=1 Tax=Kwoniella heveanensis BCC8398 TaxID=1296120 RepID=A0A1B9H2A4_9TREE|nr:hypothetical protein I316_00525 [Kwoniella heveanensis BCC8398]